MKTQLIFTVIIFIIIQNISLGQDLVYEAPMIREDGILKSTRIVVGFNKKVIDTDRGISIVDPSIYPIRDNDVKRLLDTLAKRYGKPTIRKTIPDRVWEDSLVFNRRTNKWVKVPNRSQSFRIDFPTFIPLDSVIYLFQEIPVVKYAEQTPVIHPLYEPNDQFLNSQWYLDKIDAENAWEISKGSDEIRVAIIGGTDQAEPYDISNHEDFQLPGGGNKFVDGFSNLGGDHQRWVAGVVGATTDNLFGIASLGWNVSLLTFNYPSGTAETNLPEKIAQAWSHDPHGGKADILNFSFVTLGDCDGKYCPRNFEQVSIEIMRARLAGIIMVASAGNGAYGGCPTSGYECDGEPSFNAWPAMYNGVIAVSGTNESDEFVEGWNYGPFVDVSAPGTNILTTAKGYSDYTTLLGGTSFSAPLVSALASLILAVDDFTAEEVEEIIKAGAEKVGSYKYVNGRNDHLGYGRINAHEALLETLERTAKENKSINETATAHNGSRKLVKDASGFWHLVFASGGEVFYRKRAPWNSWYNPIRLSDGNGKNNFPCITEKSGKVYIVWQREQNSGVYEIRYAASMNGGSSFSNKYVLSTISVSADPLPVIQTTVASSASLLVAFRYASGIQSKWTFYTDPSSGNWDTKYITVFGSSSNSPTLTGAVNGSNTMTGMAFANSTSKQVYYTYFNPSTTSWSGTNTLSSIIPGSNYTHKTPSISAVPNSSQINVAWHRVNGSGSSPYDHVIIHRKSTNYYSWPSSYTTLYYESQQLPSITTTASNKADVVFQHLSNNQIYKQHYNGTYWNAPSLIAGNSQ